MRTLSWWPKWEDFNCEWLTPFSTCCWDRWPMNPQNDADRMMTILAPFLGKSCCFSIFFVCYKWMRCQVFGLNMEDVIFLKDIPSAENLFFDVFGGDLTQWWVGDSGENHGILHHFSWIQWQRVEWKGARKFSLRSSPLKLVSCKLYSRNGQEHIFKKNSN